MKLKITVAIIFIFFWIVAITITINKPPAPEVENKICISQEQIDTDSRCLYVYKNNVYEKGTREKPHKGQPCGINVDANIPDLHFVGDVLVKFDNSKIGPYCDLTIIEDSPVNPTKELDYTQFTKPLTYASLLALLVSVLIVIF